MKLLRDPYFWRAVCRGAIEGVIIVAITLLLAAALRAATINPPPGSEGDTLAIVAAACPECVRVSDDQDIDFSAATGYYIFAFEDMHGAPSDFDYNDVIVEFTRYADGYYSWLLIASYTAANDAFGFDGIYPYITATDHPYVAQSWSAPWLNSDGLDHMATWRLPATAVPEPNPALAVLGCLAVAWFCWRKR